MLLTRLPLPLRGVRLACVKPAASVRSEPGSNSPIVFLVCLNRRSPDFRLRESGSLIRGHSECRALARPSGALFKELTAKSAVSHLLGLLFGFQRPSRLYRPRPVCYRCGFRRFFFNRGAAVSIRSRFLSQAPFLRSFAASLGFPPVRQCFGASFRGEAASTSSPPRLSTSPFPAFDSIVSL